MQMLEHLRCPYCAGRFAAEGQVETSGYGCLVCSCGRFPVVEGIPIIKADASAVSQLIQQGRHTDALLECLEPRSPELAPRWLRRARPASLQTPVRHAAHRMNARSWRERWRGVLQNLNGTTTACDVFEAFYTDSDVLEYFRSRHYLPRYLNGLSLLSILPDPSQPLIDIGCGAGHACGAFLRRHPSARVTGIDGVFFGLFMAKRFIASGAAFLCCDLEQGLPFADRSFAAAFCSDTLHYIRSKPLLLAETRRVVQPGGTILMADVNNARSNTHRVSFPLTPETYASLMGGPHRCISTRAAVNAYSQGFGPPLSHSASPEGLAGERFLNLVAGDASLFRDFPRFNVWPHAAGELHLSPLYRLKPGAASDQVLLERCYSSQAFEERNPGCEFYPQRESTTVQALRDIRDNQRSPEVERLIGRCIVYGTPQRYDRDAEIHEFLRASILKSALTASAQTAKV